MKGHADRLHWYGVDGLGPRHYKMAQVSFNTVVIRILISLLRKANIVQFIIFDLLTHLGRIKGSKFFPKLKDPFIF